MEKTKLFNNSDDLRKFCNSTGCPRKFADLPIEGMVGDPAYTTVLEKLKRVAAEDLRTGAHRAKPVFVKIGGPFGSGKTRMVVYMLAEAYLGMGRIGNSARIPMFLRAADLTDLRFTRMDEAEEGDDDRREVRRERLFTAELLVIDDLTRIAGYRGEEHWVERVIERRWEADRSTILTLNSRESSLNPRFEDFLKYFDTYVFAGSSHRE